MHQIPQYQLPIQLDALGFTPAFSCDWGLFELQRGPIIPIGRVGEVADISTADALIVHVTTDDGLAWTAAVESGPGYLSALVCAPTPGHLCAILSGVGFVIPVDEPTRYLSIPIDPIVEIHRVPDTAVVLIVGLEDIVALGAAGILWTARYVAQDGIIVDEITAHTVRGHGDGADEERVPAFNIEVASGRVQILGYVPAGRRWW